MKITQTHPYLKVLSCNGKEYELRKAKVHLRGGEPTTVYYFTLPEHEARLLNHKSERATLPPHKVVHENHRNGFLSLRAKD